MTAVGPTRAVRRARLVIVGASLAGVRAAKGARETGFDGEIVLIGAESQPPYDRPPLSKRMLLEAADPDYLSAPDELASLDVEMRLGLAATGLDTDRRLVLLGRERLPYDRLVIATGAAARRLPSGHGLSGVHTLRELADSAAIRVALESGARPVIIGAGFIGSEVASAARAHGVAATIVEALEVPLARAVGAEPGAALSALHRRHGTTLMTSAAVAEIVGARRVEGVRLTDGRLLPADLVVVGVGAAPATAWLHGSGVALHERDGGVVCDATLAIDVPGVFAAGDVAHWYNGTFGSLMRLEHWTNAAEQGAVAGRNAVMSLTGEPLESYCAVPYFWSDWYGSRIQFLGTADAEQVVLARPADADGGPFLALFRRADRIVGALALDRRRVMRFRPLIAGRAPWRDALSLADEVV